MKIAFYKSAKGTLLDKVVDVGSGLYGYSHCELVFDNYDYYGIIFLVYFLLGQTSERWTMMAFIFLNKGIR